jgi:peptide-methionine (S)-S-oxide reductase
MQKAIFGGGCFWCVEAIFNQLKGVEKVVSGYSGGKLQNPTYEQVSMGNTGYAEVIEVEYDPTVISFEQLVEVFFLNHDPTTKNRQGADVGEQYRSVIFYNSEEQKKIAEKIKSKIEQEQIYPGPIVTEILPFFNFYPAEEYHQNYYKQNLNKPYCQLVISPKLAKFRTKFAGLLK